MVTKLDFKPESRVPILFPTSGGFVFGAPKFNFFTLLKKVNFRVSLNFVPFTSVFYFLHDIFY